MFYTVKRRVRLCDVEQAAKSGKLILQLCSSNDSFRESTFYRVDYIDPIFRKSDKASRASAGVYNRDSDEVQFTDEFIPSMLHCGTQSYNLSFLHKPSKFHDFLGMTIKSLEMLLNDRYPSVYVLNERKVHVTAYYLDDDMYPEHFIRSLLESNCY